MELDDPSVHGDRRTPTEEPAGVRTRGFGIFAGGFFDSPTAVGAVAAAGLLCGIALSPRLWFPFGRAFPRAPLFVGPPQTLTPAAEWLLSGLLVVALAALLSGRRPGLFTSLAVASLSLLALLDQ